MTADPIRKFLGVSGKSEPRALLGLRAKKLDAVMIEMALRNRIAKTYAHAEGRSDEAEQVRKRLRQAARTVLEALRPPQPPQPLWPPVKPLARHPVARLTDFDRHVLAVLVGCGGWNAAARQRLVGVAAAYGVSVEGLFKVVQGLSDYGKAGGAPLGLEQITAGEARADFKPLVLPTRKEPDPTWLARVAPELMESTLRSTLRLSLLFGAVTVLLGVIAIRILLVSDERPEPAGPPRPIPTAVEAVTPRRPAPPPVRQLATFPDPPTFSGRALTPEALTAADECSRLAGELDTLARRITIADEPSEAVFRSWADCIRTIAIGWVQVGDSVREEVDQAIFDALYAASDSPSVSDRLLEVLTPPPWSILEPVELWRGAWVAGTLARISQSSSLSPAVVDRAQAQLDAALGGPSVERATSFEDAAGAWLDHAAALLVDATGHDPGIYDPWEFWITAQRRLGRGDRFERAMLNAVETLLASSLDLTRPGPGVNVLGRLLGLIDFESSRVVKDRIGALLTDQDRFTSRDVWLLTSLLAQAEAVPWFSEDLVLPADADWMFRRRIADRISQRWPEAATAEDVAEAVVRGVAVDPEVAARWLAFFNWLQKQEIEGTSERLLDQLVVACRLNQAACWLAAGNAQEAADMLTAMESGGLGDDAWRGAAPRRARRTGEPIGADGGWAVEYEQAGRGAEERRKWLEALRANAGTDLGPIDAAVFVRVVYRGSPPEIRELAQATLVEQFGDGPSVALEMLDQLPGVPPGRAISDAIGQLTSRLLPSPHSDSWPVDARLALVEHTLDLLGPTFSTVDDKLGAVIRSYADRRIALDPDASSATPFRTAREAADGLAEAWRRRAMDAVGEAPEGRVTTGGLLDLQRRHATRLQLVSGPVQGFVAAQLAVLDLMAYAAVLDQPAQTRAVADMLAESGARRSRCARALEQAVEAERAMGRVWRVQMAVEGGGGDES